MAYDTPADSFAPNSAQMQQSVVPAPTHPVIPSLDAEDVMNDFQRRSTSGITHSKDWRDETKDLYDFVAGRQWDTDDEARMREANRPMITFNMMSKFIDVVTGLQINNRQQIRCYPRDRKSVV